MPPRSASPTQTRERDGRAGSTRERGVRIAPLSERRRAAQLELALRRGLAVDEIAQALWLSRHTVRDYTKTIFSKLGVSSRPELTAKLFAEHFLPELERVDRTSI